MQLCQINCNQMKLNEIQKNVQLTSENKCNTEIRSEKKLPRTNIWCQIKNLKQTPKPNAETDQAGEERRGKARGQTAQRKTPTDDNQTGTQKKRGGRRPGQRPRRANQQTPPPAQATCAANSHPGKPGPKHHLKVTTWLFVLLSPHSHLFTTFCLQSVWFTCYPQICFGSVTVWHAHSPTPVSTPAQSCLVTPGWNLLLQVPPIT